MVLDADGARVREHCLQDGKPAIVHLGTWSADASGNPTLQDALVGAVRYLEKVKCAPHRCVYPGTGTQWTCPVCLQAHD